MTFVFKPRQLDERPGTRNDRPPRWHKSALGQVIECAGRAVFVANAMHPALRTSPERDLGVADNSSDAMMAAAERAFRDANLVKREWRRAKKAAKEARLAKLGERFAKAA